MRTSNAIFRRNKQECLLIAFSPIPSLYFQWILFEPRHEKPGFCICENKDADQLRGEREADQRLCFRYTDSTIPLLPKSEISSYLLWLHCPVFVGPG